MPRLEPVIVLMFPRAGPHSATPATPSTRVPGCSAAAASAHGACARGGEALSQDRRAFPSTSEAERDALLELARPGALRLPRPLAVGQTADHAFLLLEYLQLDGPKMRALPALGEGLAQLHRQTAPRFGWHRNNAIGATPQENGCADDWVTFWRERRLGFQLELARKYGRRRLQREAAQSAAVGQPVTGVASLLHGDLCGNGSATPAGSR